MAFDAGTSPPDADLLRRYAAGDQAAARLLTQRHAPRLLALSRRMLADGAEAEDVTQEAMLRLWQIAPEWLDGEASLSTWLYRVTSNLCIDRLRRRRGRFFDVVPDVADGSPSVVLALERGDRSAALAAALETLPERQRLAIILKHLEDRGNSEVAAIMDTSVEAVESLLARGRRALARHLLPMRAEIGLTDGDA